MSVRLRRLQSDYEKICTAFTGKKKISLMKTIGNPPEKYQLEYHVNGLEKDLSSDYIRMRNNFIVEIVLTSAYPRMAPQCKMLTPVFHPNIAPHAICIGDHWAAGESLPNLIIRIAEMLSYQSYNVKSPLNGEAAQWAEENMEHLPVDTYDFSSLLAAGEVVSQYHAAHAEGSICVNCGQEATDTEPLAICLNHHLTCQNCQIHCERCNALMCLKCSNFKCSQCGGLVCHNCIHKCPGCGSLVCLDHNHICETCGIGYCEDCTITCQNCSCDVCINDVRKVLDVKNNRIYLCAACEEMLQTMANET